MRAVVFLILFTIAIPWYWSAFGSVGRQQVIGVPVWFAVAVAGSLVISGFAAWCLHTPWPDEADDGGREAPP